MRKVKCSGLADAIEKLQCYINERWPGMNNSICKRKWLKATPKDSYGDKTYRIEIWVLEGSPVKALVIVDHHNKEICCHGPWIEKERLFYWEEKI